MSEKKVQEPQKLYDVDLEQVQGGALATDGDCGMDLPLGPKMAGVPLSPETPKKGESELPLGVEIALEVATAPLPGWPMTSTITRLVKKYGK